MQETRESNDWESWIIYILDAVEETALQTSFIIKEIKKLMASHKQKIRSDLPKIYSQDLINSLFKHPYTKIEYIKQDLGVARKTAGRYLDQLCKAGLITKNKIGKENYYFNNDLISLLINVSSLKKENEDRVIIRTEHN